MPRGTVTIGPLLYFPTQVKSCSRWCNKGFNLMWSKKPSCPTWIQKSQSHLRPNCEHLLDTATLQRISEKVSLCFIDYGKVFDCMDHEKIWVALKEMGVPQHLVILMHNILWKGSHCQDRKLKDRMVSHRQRGQARVHCISLFV